MNILVLTNRKTEEDGIIANFQGNRLPEVPEGETLARVMLRWFRDRGYDIQDGDVMFFPEAHPGGRFCVVDGDDASRGIVW